MDAVRVGSLDALRSLSAALSDFADAAASALAGAESASRNATEAAEAARDELAWDLARLEAAADDPDGDGSTEDLDDLAEQLERLEETASRMDRAQERFSCEANSFRNLASDVVPGARTFLERKLDQLRLYLELPPPHPGAVPGVLATSARGSATGRSGRPINTLSLPPGFTWVCLAEIEEIRLAPADFKKVSEAEMERGVHLLLTEVLPRLQQEPSAEAATFDALDRKLGWLSESGTRRTFEAFFGTDGIRLERRSGDATYAITDGRHRIQTARQMGLTHVPARAVEIGR